jgi:peptidoglycan hydrolase-like protein with peptidoglycan-binding domain
MSYQIYAGQMYGGFGYTGLGSDFRIGVAEDGMRALQRELARLGYLQNDTSAFGADGKFGSRTATALRSAARYVGYTADPYTPADADRRSSGTVSVPDDLIARIRAASPDPMAIAAGTPSGAGPVLPSEPAPPPEEPSMPSGPPEWFGPVMVTVGLFTVAGLTLAFISDWKKPVAANRGRRRRRRR